MQDPCQGQARLESGLPGLGEPGEPVGPGTLAQLLVLSAWSHRRPTWARRFWSTSFWTRSVTFSAPGSPDAGTDPLASLWASIRSSLRLSPVDPGRALQSPPSPSRVLSCGGRTGHARSSLLTEADVSANSGALVQPTDGEGGSNAGAGSGGAAPAAGGGACAAPTRWSSRISKSDQSSSASEALSSPGTSPPSGHHPPGCIPGGPGPAACVRGRGAGRGVRGQSPRARSPARARPPWRDAAGGSQVRRWGGGRVRRRSRERNKRGRACRGGRERAGVGGEGGYFLLLLPPAPYSPVRNRRVRAVSGRLPGSVPPPGPEQCTGRGCRHPAPPSPRMISRISPPPREKPALTRAGRGNVPVCPAP